MLLDTFAWLEYFDGTEPGRRVGQALDAGPVYTCPTVLAELTSILTRRKGHEAAGRYVRYALEAGACVDETAEVGVEAGRIHAEMKEGVPGFGMADAFVLAAARSRGVKVLTGDPHFEDVEDAEML